MRLDFFQADVSLHLLPVHVAHDVALQLCLLVLFSFKCVHHSLVQGSETWEDFGAGLACGLAVVGCGIEVWFSCFLPYFIE